MCVCVYACICMCVYIFYVEKTRDNIVIKLSLVHTNNNNKQTSNN